MKRRMYFNSINYPLIGSIFGIKPLTMGPMLKLDNLRILVRGMLEL